MVAGRRSNYHFWTTKNMFRCELFVSGRVPGAICSVFQPRNFTGFSHRNLLHLAGIGWPYIHHLRWANLDLNMFPLDDCLLSGLLKAKTLDKLRISKLYISSFLILENYWWIIFVISQTSLRVYDFTRQKGWVFNSYPKALISATFMLKKGYIYRNFLYIILDVPSIGQGLLANWRCWIHLLLNTS